MLTSSVFLGLLVALLRGGDLRRLARMPFRWWWLFVAAFLLKFALVRWGAQGNPWMLTYGPALHLVVYLLVLTPLLLNRRLPWMGWVLAGAGLNFAVVAANGGRMPVLAQALEALGKGKTLEQLRAGADAAHTLVAPETLLPWLGDWVPLPFPLAAAVSPGDVLLAAGVVLFINTVTQPSYRLAGPPAEEAPGPPGQARP